MTTAFIRTLPKVLLHDHLDGGLRPQTIVDLAKEQRYTGLPTTDAGALARWFERGAYEMMEDMHRDGVVYVETRFAPLFHTSRGLHGDEVVSAVLTGLERGK